MLSAAETAEVAGRFGVAPAQVQRDYVISHLLAALSSHVGDQVLFFGGTALARTHLSAGRLSEDLDLLVAGGATRTAVAAEIDALFSTGLRRTLGRMAWHPSLGEVKGAQGATLVAPLGVTVRVQLMHSDGYPD